MAKGRQCSGLTVRGNQCKLKAITGDQFCAMHNHEAEQSTIDSKAAFVEALANVHAYSAAARQVNVSTRTALWWRQEDHAFATECLEARRDCRGTVEASLVARAIGTWAVEEIREPDPKTGELVVIRQTRKRIFSDKAAAMIMAANEPTFRSGYIEPPAALVDPEHERVARAMIMDAESNRVILEQIRRHDPEIQDAA